MSDFNLTIPPEESKYLQNLYSRKTIILEYGTGGSTLMALRANAENIVLGAETDPRWLSLLASEISQQGMGDRF